MFECKICNTIFNESHSYSECRFILINKIMNKLSNLNVQMLKTILNYINNKDNNELLSN